MEILIGGFIGLLGIVTGLCLAVYGLQEYELHRSNLRHNERLDDIDAWLEQMQSQEDYLARKEGK